MKEMIISTSPRRNHKMVVFHNTDWAGKKFSVTCHLPIDPSKPCIRRSFKRKTN